MARTEVDYVALVRHGETLRAVADDLEASSPEEEIAWVLERARACGTGSTNPSPTSLPPSAR